MLKKACPKEDGEMYWFNRFEYQNELFKSLSSEVIDVDGKPKISSRKQLTPLH